MSNPVTLLTLLPPPELFTSPLSPPPWIWLTPIQPSKCITCVIAILESSSLAPSSQLGCYILSRFVMTVVLSTQHPNCLFTASRISGRKDRFFQTEFYVSIVTLVSRQLSLKHGVKHRTGFLGCSINRKSTC